MRPPRSVLFARCLVWMASQLVPREERENWRREWHAEIWHRWQFLEHARLWSNREALRLLRQCAGVFPDACWYLSEQESVRIRTRDLVRSPWTCLGALSLLLVLLAVASFGFPATRNLFASGLAPANKHLLYIWFHPSAGGGDEGLPPDAIAAWGMRSRLLSGIAPFTAGHPNFQAGHGANAAQPLVIRTQPSLFRVLAAHPFLGNFPEHDGVVLSYELWRKVFRGDPRALGTLVRIGHTWHPVAAVLPREFRFLSREPAAYLVQPALTDAQLMIVARLRPGVTEERLDRELTRIAETACYYFFRGQLRYSLLASAAWTPMRIFAAAAGASMLLLLLVSRFPLQKARAFFTASDRRAAGRRAAFFAAKTLLAGLCVLIAGIELSRSQSAILYASRDPAAGPLLLWLYILGTMGTLFWAVADGRARCRVCLKLLCFPVRVGCPGCLLLNWSGTELLCPDGHGMMHVPDLAPSWDKEAEHWISLDDSWHDLFAESK